MTFVRDLSLFLLGMALVGWLCGCGDDEPSRMEQCKASCEARGGEFYQMQGEYCYCAWTESTPVAR